MKPIYKFVLDEETGKITVDELTDYDKVNEKWVTKSYYRYKRNNLFYYIYDADLDKFKHGHVYSFNPDIEHAKEIIVEAIGQKLAKAQADVTRWAKVFMEIHTEIK